MKQNDPGGGKFSNNNITSPVVIFDNFYGDILPRFISRLNTVHCRFILVHLNDGFDDGQTAVDVRVVDGLVASGTQIIGSRPV